uniref:Putative secreted protein n=1 Tax=Anopheles marajoara TaxID=58244 RepID=A0A2M4CE10_9DIPT
MRERAALTVIAAAHATVTPPETLRHPPILAVSLRGRTENRESASEREIYGRKLHCQMGPNRDQQRGRERGDE